MTVQWSLPVEVTLGDQKYSLNGDFRDILEIFSYFSKPDLPDYVKWEIALALFYQQEIPEKDRQEAMKYLSWFLAGGKQEEDRPGPKLIDWEQDAPLIAADINKAAGQEIRAMPFLHWWTFLSWFHAIGEGQLSTVVAIRSKLAKGKKLESWEMEFYRENRFLVDFQRRYSQQELEEKEKLEQLLK